MIEISGLTKRYGEFLAVDNLSLSIGEGELLSLLGVNGAGKTTTIKMLCCLLKPDSGDVQILGEALSGNPQKIKEQINLSPQETAVALNLTVKENLEFIAQIYGQKKELAVEFANRFDLSGVMKKRAKQLSGGMQRRLSIAMALISSPKILFLDEPTLGLDVLARRQLWSLIKSLKGEVTIILTTHYLEEAEALSDRVGIMANGKLTAVGTVAELKKQANADSLEEAFILLNGGQL